MTCGGATPCGLMTYPDKGLIHLDAPAPTRKPNIICLPSTALNNAIPACLTFSVSSTSTLITSASNMLEYFTYKKIKKHQAEKRAEKQVQTPILNEEDENFLERIVSAEGTPPPLPERPSYIDLAEAGDTTRYDAQMVIHDPTQASLSADNTTKELANEKGDSDKRHKGKGKVDENEKKKPSRFSFFHKKSTGQKHDEQLEPTNSVVTPAEAEREEEDITKVLDDLNLAAVNNRAISISKESQELVQKFTVVLKDLINGVPTAYDDLVKLIEDGHGTLAKSYEHLPKFLKKLVATLPSKMTTSLGPELLAAAAESQAFSGAEASTSAAGAAGLGATAKSLLSPTVLKNLITKPGAVVGMLKAILNVLKTRWPAFMGTNVLLSLALFGKTHSRLSFKHC